jgi:hypothetical protein
MANKLLKNDVNVIRESYQALLQEIQKQYYISISLLESTSYISYAEIESIEKIQSNEFCDNDYYCMVIFLSGLIPSTSRNKLEAIWRELMTEWVVTETTMLLQSDLAVESDTYVASNEISMVSDSNGKLSNSHASYVDRLLIKLNHLFCLLVSFSANLDFFMSAYFAFGTAFRSKIISSINYAGYHIDECI